MRGSLKYLGVNSQHIKVIALMIGSIILFVLAAILIWSLPKRVNASFLQHDDVSTEPEVLLTHANTYYWWGRYRKNTLPEFDTAAKMATQALHIADARLKIDGDTGKFQIVERQAAQIIKLAREQAEICRYNLSTYVPAYMEIMGHDQAYMQEDADGKDVPFIALRGAIGRLTNLLSPNRNQAIGTLSHFTLLNVNTYNPLAEEMLVQELNNSTRMYTISRHELSRILELDSVRVSDLLGDSIAMARVARAFDTDELAMIDFQENDRVNGIYYYAMRLRFWTVDKGWQSKNVFTEFMTRDRVFNQLSGIILPLFIAFMLMAFALNLFLNSLVHDGKSRSRISLLHLPLSFLLATIVQYILVNFVLKNFLNPASEDYFVSDGAELWVIAYPLTFILPVFINYLMLGKLDNFIPQFHSDLENPVALFELVSGTLLTIPCVFTYNQVLRFGTGLELTSILPLIGVLTAISFLISRHWATIINFPERVHPLKRMSTWLALAVYVWLVFSLLSDLQLHYDPAHLRGWIWGAMIPAIVMSESIHYLIRRLFRHQLQIRSQDENVPRPIGLKDFKLTSQPFGVSIINNASGLMAASLYVKSERGMPVGPAIESQFSMQKRPDSIRIDFSAALTYREVHYPAFAQGFEFYLPAVKFNDATETARKTSNVLGRLISALNSSVGDAMIDDRQTQGRNPAELARLLLDIPWSEPAIWFLDHVEEMKEEDLVLLEHLIREIRDRRSNQLQVTKNQDAHNKLPLIICCGFGEFGLRDRLYAALALLEGEGLSGLHEYTVKYDQPAKQMLAKERFPIQLRLHLETLFRRERRDHSPDFISKTLFMLRRRGNFMHYPDMPFTLAALDQLISLPDIDGDKTLMNLSKLEPQFQQILIAAAYISDEHGRFYLPVLAHIVKMDCLPLLQSLKEAEIQNLVYDLKGVEHFYWFAFTDRTIIAGLKSIDNPRKEAVSQIAYECYKGYVEYYFPSQNLTDIINIVRRTNRQRVINTDSIILLASRAYAIRPIYPMLVFKINYAAAMILSEPGLTRYDEALQCAERVWDLRSMDEIRNHPDSGVIFFDIKKIRFTLWLETGQIKEKNPDAWLDDIKRDRFYSLQSNNDRIRFLLTEIRFRFTRFSSEYQDQTKGAELCEELLTSQLNDEQQRWVRFYTIKLIPAIKFKPGQDQWVNEAIRVNGLYCELLKELEYDHDSSDENRELYRQVLNDYGGSFLGDKLLPSVVQNHQKEDVLSLLALIGEENSEALFKKVKLLLSRRIDLERLQIGESNSDLEPFDKKPLMSLLQNEDPVIDKRGICYTLNYLSRAYLTFGHHRQCVETGELAYRFNTLVGDKRGCCVAAGTIASAYEHLANHLKAYEWFERSFGHGWDIKDPSTASMALSSYRVATAVSCPILSARSAAYLRQITLRTLIYYFPKSSYHEVLAYRIMSSVDCLKLQATVDQIDDFLGGSLEEFLDKSNPCSFECWKNEVIKKGSVKGHDKALWFKVGNTSFDWVIIAGDAVSNAIERKTITLEPVGMQKKYHFILNRTTGMQDWFISSLIIDS